MKQNCLTFSAAFALNFSRVNQEAPHLVETDSAVWKEWFGVIMGSVQGVGPQGRLSREDMS